MGTYAIEQNTLTAGGNYDLSFVPANLTITKRELMAQADDKNRGYGQANPELTISYTGFVTGEDPTVLDVPPSAATLADTGSPVGTYEITVSGGSDNNYSLGLSNGTLTVTLAAESIIPTITLVSPTAGDYPTNQIQVRGTATDKVPGKVARVLVRVNGGTWQLATLGAHKTNLGVASVNWTNLVTMATGTNLLEVMAQDTSLNNSLSKTAKVFYRVPGSLLLVANGSGSMTISTAAPYYVGRRYSLTAKPSLNNLFSNVVANGTILYSAPPAAQTGTNNIYFIMQTNLMLVGNFDTNRFIGAKGTYHGLFSDVGGVAHQSAGYITFRTTKGLAFSGTMYVEGESVALAGKFDLAGVGTLTKLATRKGLTNQPINVVPVIDFSNKQIKGTVSSLSNGWTAEIDTDLAVYNLTNSPPLGALGRYTMRLPSSGLAGQPGGDGYATFNVKRSATSGAVQLATDTDPTLTAMLGIPVSANYFGDQERMTVVGAVPPSKDGRYPFYAKLYKYYRPALNPRTPPTTGIQTTYKGSVLGWLTIGSSNVTGDLVWNKIGWTNGLYNAGFSNEVAVAGSPYVPPAAFQKVIALNSNAVVVLQGGNLSAPITNKFHLVLTGTGANSLLWPTAGTTNNPHRISLTVNARTGRIEGSFVPDPLFPTVKASVKGSVLQNGNRAHGNFKGTSESGSMLMYQPPGPPGP